MDAEYKFGDLKTTPYSEPAWYDSRNYSPYYTDAHREWRQVVRTFVDTEIMPFRDEWDAKGKIPDELFIKAGKIGLLAATVGWPDKLSPVPRPKGYDTFFSVIAMDELCRCGSSGIVWGLVGGMGISLHPLIHADSEVAHAAVKKVLTGEWKSCLAVSEAQAGSDVANLTTTAVEEGDNLIINGNKKWITCGLFSDVMVAAVKLQDGSKGFAAIRLVLVPSRAKGVTIREMDCMGAKGSGTAFIEYDDVVVPKANVIGGADQLLSNFVGERLGIALQATRFARVCLAESIEYVRRRKAFGKPLEEQPVVRQQIAEMAKRVESTWAWIESVVGRVVQMEREETNWFEGIMRMGAEAALLKVQGSEVFEFCAAQAALLHGGNSYVRGNRIEHLYRAVISLKIPGGAPAPIQDSAMRLALKGKL